MQVQNTDKSKVEIEPNPPSESRLTTTSSEGTRSSDTPRTIVEFLEVSPNIPFNDWPKFPNPFKHPLVALKWLFRTLFSLVALIGVFAAIAAVPVLSILVLGFLLEVEGRVVRSGRFRDAFPLLPLAPRIGSIAVGVGIWLVPLFFLAGLAADVALIDPDGDAAARWIVVKVIASISIAVHLCLALSRGGSFGCFFRPIKNIRWLLSELRNRPVKRCVRCPDCGEAVVEKSIFCTLCGFTLQSEDSVSDDEPSENSNQDLATTAVLKKTYWHRADQKTRRFLQKLRLKHHFLLGCRGLVGAIAILLVPTLLFAAARNSEGVFILLTLLGGACLSGLFLYVPFLQAQLASENRLGAMFEWRRVRELYPHAPIAWLLTLLIVYAMALPLYLFTAVLPPRDMMWLVTPIFVMSIYPARIATGWAYARAARKKREGRSRSHFVFRHGCRVLMLLTTLAYTLFFFFVRDIGRTGRLVLFEHHAFLGTSVSALFSLLP